MRRFAGGAIKLQQIAVGIVILGLAGAVYVAIQPRLPATQTRNCQSNFKRIGIAVIQYVRDYDEHYPRAENWSDAVKPYSGGWQPDLVSSAENEALYFCPKTGGLTVYNRNLAGVSIGLDIDPATPMAYEAGADQKRQNFSDVGQSWPMNPIHPNKPSWGNHVVFSDAHAEIRSVKPNFRVSIMPTSTPKQTAQAEIEVAR